MMAEKSNSENNIEKAETLQISLAKKRECFKKAKTVVEKFLEENVSESLLLENIRFITQSDYQDVVEERVVLKLCGYTICKNKLENIPKKKYHISTTSNRVYDITERKKFCSNLCYKASVYLKEQVLTSPVWFREFEEIPQFHLLPTHDKIGQIGEEVFLDISKVSLDSKESTLEKDKVEFVSTFAINALQELEKVGGPCYESLFIKEKCSTQTNIMKNPQQQSSNETIESSSKRQTIASKADISGDNKTEGNQNMFSENLPKPALEKTRIVVKKTVSSEESKVLPSTQSVQQINYKQHSILEIDNQNTNDSKASQILEKGTHSTAKIKNIDISNKQPGAMKKQTLPAIKNDVKHGVERVEEVSYQWFTIDSAIYMYGIDNVVKSLLKKAENYETESQTSKSEAMKNQFLKLCKELEDKKNKLSTENNGQIKQDLTDLELKVKAFYEGKTRITPISVVKEQEFKPILPDVDRYSQKSARQKIVFSRLSKVLSELFEIFGISIQDVTSDVRSLLETFDFAANNIMLKPNEWNLVGLLIIKMVAAKNHELKEELSRKKCLKCLAMMLKSYDLKPEFLDTFIHNLSGVKELN